MVAILNSKWQQSLIQDGRRVGVGTLFSARLFTPKCTSHVRHYEHDENFADF
jgi:hypothetical protein